ncbi:AzlC family ABC transporter permease [Haloarcula sp. S1CR25-12]|uniref:AzlC family ABC transporter permease n=1 Tax=Haloarcula saliterrae TaxID=2950534 RepID=A0ABU2FFN6_9EURY|nr:AzlC family ABC transporter permease [Haloarcula sp. S1CR25-12]MDS0261072.1 AzlC family ABC transporter permease [Haloarcula sp. S1CR25-12]
MDRSEFRQGVRDVVPLLLGIIPFGFIAGIATVNAGLGLPEAVGLSTIVFAGAAQLAALDLIGRDAPLAIIVVTALVINLRMLMYSASIAPHFQRLSSRTKAAVAYLLTDQAYALAIARYRTDDSARSVAYYFGVAATLWVVWQLTTIAGVVLGTSVPESLGLEFAVPLVFLALLVPAMEDGPTTIAGILGGTVAVVTAGLPLNLGLLVGASVGVLAGLLTETATEGSSNGD